MSAPVENLLSRLQGVKQTGKDRWLARCPTREDKHPSMTIRELEDGRVLIHDFAGDSPESILSAIGLEFSDLFPPRADNVHVIHGERRPFHALDVLKALSHEALIVVAAIRQAQKDGFIKDENVQRLLVASERIMAAVAYAEAPDARRRR